MEFVIGNLKCLEQKLHLKEHGEIPTCEILKEKEVRKILRKIPKKYDIETIKKFEKETGIVLKYWVFTPTSFREYTCLGIHPAPCNDNQDFSRNYLSNFDILVAINKK